MYSVMRGLTVLHRDDFLKSECCLMASIFLKGKLLLFIIQMT